MLAIKKKGPCHIWSEGELKKIKPQELFAEKVIKKERENEDGSITTFYIHEIINVSKYVNETKKLIKLDQAQQKIKELEGVFTNHA